MHPFGEYGVFHRMLREVGTKYLNSFTSNVKGCVNDENGFIRDYFVTSKSTLKIGVLFEMPVRNSTRAYTKVGESPQSMADTVQCR